MTTFTPKTKLLLACALLGALSVMAIAQVSTAAGAARLTLGALSAAGLGWWWWRQGRRRSPEGFTLGPRMEVLQRVGLSPRTGLALVEVDGRSYLVSHGETFVTVKALGGPRPVRPRRALATDTNPALRVRRTSGGVR
jgi:hypothetical protein